MLVELFQQQEGRARLPAARQYRAILAAVTEELETYFPTRPASKRAGLSHAAVRRLSPPILSPHVCMRPAPSAQIVCIVRRKGGPSAQPLVAQSTDAFATRPRSEQGQAQMRTVLVHAPHE